MHVYSEPGAPREFVHSMMDDGHVVDYWSLFGKKVFSTLKEASSYLYERPHSDNGDVIYEVGKIGGIDVYLVYTKEEVLEILKEEAE